MVSVGDATVPPGDTGALPVTISCLEDGLAGFDITVTLSPGTAGEILSVATPAYGVRAGLPRPYVPSGSRVPRGIVYACAWLT